MQNYPEALKGFRQGVKQKNPRFYAAFTQIQKTETIRSAVELAYNDAKRTMKGIGSQTKSREAALSDITNGLQAFFAAAAPQSADEFDKKHKALCALWLKHFPGSHIATYGKAQKIVNMSFKYLCCCEDAAAYAEHFRYCHVPLDTYTLKWFCRECRDRDIKIKKSSIASWSKITAYDGDEADGCPAEQSGSFYPYMFFERYFREWFPCDAKLTPLQAEFIYWPAMM